MLQTLDLFAGIGGFALGLERTGGFKTVAFCEIEPYPRAVLAKHWPGVKQYDDVRTLTGARLGTDGIAVDVITGGFPCQDISKAGKQAGISDDTRSGLWSEIARLVGEIRPRYVIVENVSALLSGPSERRGGWFGRVLGDLAEIGYDAEWHCIPASYVGAPHRRDRVWIVAHADNRHRDADEEICAGRHAAVFEGPDVADAEVLQRDGGELHGKHAHCAIPKLGARGRSINVSDPNSQGLQGWTVVQDKQPARSEWGRHFGRDGWWPPEPNVGRVAHGVAKRVDRLKALGNAVVPKIPEMIGHAILEREKETCNQ
jgi:DNA (cytosine-5)-methyltransferase 1